MTEQDKELFSQIYYQYYKRLLYAAIHIVHNFSIAEELTNETFTILLAQFDPVRRHPNLDRWLYTVLTNQALNELKKQMYCRMDYQKRIRKFCIFAMNRI